MAQTKFFSDQTAPLIIKQGNQSVTNSIVLVADNHLVLPNLIANATYWVELKLAVQGTAAAGGLQVSFTVPSGALIQGLWSSSAVANSSVIQNSNAAVTVITAANMKARQIAIGRFFLNIAATGGTLTLNWAQATANAAATIVAGGSTIDWVRVI